MASIDQNRVSDQLVRLVQVFFALVLAQGLFLFRKALLNPFAIANRIAVLATAAVFYTTVSSWVDWHVAMAHRPYDTRQHAERFRVYADVGVATLYAYLLFTIEPIVGHPDASLTRHLAGYPLVFAAYLLSGWLRVWTHGRSASKRHPLVIGFFVYTALVLGYFYVRLVMPVDWRVRLNAIALVAAFGLMWSYRAYRRHLVRRDERAAARLNIGFDVDGVLADQITGVLPMIKQRHDVALAYRDITDWRLPIKDTDIAQEIVRAQEDREYVLGMRAHEGARRVLDFLHETNRIIVITARKGEAATTWTAQWLRRNKLPYDEVVGGTEAKKSEHRTDVLVDDYIGNVLEYLANTHGVAVLVEQPWNRDRADLAQFADSRLFVVSNLLELRRRWPEVLQRALESRKRLDSEPSIVATRA
jgi:uncharacterized HAD superfamily protein